MGFVGIRIVERKLCFFPGEGSFQEFLNVVGNFVCVKGTNTENRSIMVSSKKLLEIFKEYFLHCCWVCQPYVVVQYSRNIILMLPMFHNLVEELTIFVTLCNPIKSRLLPDHLVSIVV